MSDLVAFLSARLDEREATAKRADGLSWLTDAADRDGDAWVINEHMHLCEVDQATAAHIAHNDPARALREVAADRLLLRAYEEACDWHQQYPHERDLGYRQGLEKALKIRAVIHNDHPDYRQEWAE